MISTGSSTSSGRSSNTSQSTSTPVVLQTPQSEFSLALANLLQNIGNQQYSWAQNQFNNAQGVTDAQINNYLQQANAASGAAQNLWGRYQNVIEPLSNQYIQEAGSYASTPRINFNMGQAQSAAGQAADQNASAAAQQLMSYGVNPSSGMYGELADAQKAARAASQASAGTQAGLATEQTGRQMLSNAIAMGQQLPGASVNEMNAAFQGISGAENSILGLENTGVNLMDSANPYFNTAMQVKEPPVGQQTQSTSQGSSFNTSQSNQNSSSPDRSSGQGSYNTGGSGSRGSQPRTYFIPNTPGGGGGGGYVPNAGIMNIPGGGSSNGNYWDTFGTGDSVDQTGLVDTSSFVDPNLSTSDFSTFTPDYNTTDTSNTSYDPNSMFGGGYARGGPVLPTSATSGGYVPRSASPSHGAHTDDIPARLNAKEFVIPRDVVEWKGSEFFKKLIEQSRKARGLQPGNVGGQPKAPLGGPPRFVSRGIGGR